MALYKAAGLLTTLENENKLPFMVMVAFKNVLMAAYDNAARCGETVTVIMLNNRYSFW